MGLVFFVVLNWLFIVPQFHGFARATVKMDKAQKTLEMYQREVEYELKTLSSQIEPILIVLLGVLVLILALGVFLPMWDLGQAAFAGGKR